MRATIRWAWMAALLLAMGTAHAQRMEGSRASAQGQYEAEVSVHSQSAAERNQGFSRALIQVLTKLTGERAPQQRPGGAPIGGLVSRRAGVLLGGHQVFPRCGRVGRQDRR